MSPLSESRRQARILLFWRNTMTPQSKRRRPRYWLARMGCVPLVLASACVFDRGGLPTSTASDASSARDHASSARDLRGGDLRLAVDSTGPDAPIPDAGNPRPDLGRADATTDTRPPCPAACTSCADGPCELDCSGPGGCVCPEGWDCNVNCDKDTLCKGKIDCTKATACTVNCKHTSCSGGIDCPPSGPCTIVCKQSSCTDKISCGKGPCTITCQQTACAKDIDCGSSCACNVFCDVDACGGSVTCSRAACKADTGCALTPASPCNQCP